VKLVFFTVTHIHRNTLLMKKILRSYCLNGTKTSDPFRNDTTLRPYACSPGTFCVAGTGSNEVHEGAVGFAQPCTAGFFCEAASTSAKGSGACPPSFLCPKGTATPRPTPKGFHAEHPGTIKSTACLPGFYAPTIQTEKCEFIDSLGLRFVPQWTSPEAFFCTFFSTKVTNALPGHLAVSCTN
jgi:hypothetical protein